MPPLAYCSNVHPARGLAAIAATMADEAAAIRDRLGWEALGIDLHLDARAAADARRDPGLIDHLRRILDRHRLRVTTVNAFPLGEFQAGRVKELVYRPDWTTTERLDISRELLTLALALGDGTPMVLSTLPGGYKPWGDNPAVRTTIATRLGRWAAAACRAEAATGRRAVLALEPEPWCTLETAAEAVAFFTGPLATAGVAAATLDLDGDADAALTAVTRHLGICLDTCHASVAFEDPAAAVRSYAACGAGVVKCQFSVAPAVCDPAAHPAAVAALRSMAEPRFLHQTALRTGHGVERLRDLDDLDPSRACRPDVAEIRCHFHLPIDRAPDGPTGLGFTRDDGCRGLAAARAAGEPVLSVETYTRTILAGPAGETVAGTATELAWLAAHLDRP